MNPIQKPVPSPHLELRYILDHSSLSRSEVARRLEISRQCLRNRELQIVRVKPYMIVEISKAAKFALSRIPASVRKAALKAEIELYEARYSNGV